MFALLAITISLALPLVIVSMPVSSEVMSPPLAMLMSLSYPPVSASMPSSPRQDRLRLMLMSLAEFVVSMSKPSSPVTSIAPLLVMVMLASGPVVVASMPSSPAVMSPTSRS